MTPNFPHRFVWEQSSQIVWEFGAIVEVILYWLSHSVTGLYRISKKNDLSIYLSTMLVSRIKQGLGVPLLLVISAKHQTMIHFAAAVWSNTPARTCLSVKTAERKRSDSIWRHRWKTACQGGKGKGVEVVDSPTGFFRTAMLEVIVPTAPLDDLHGSQSILTSVFHTSSSSYHLISCYPTN